MSSPQTLRSSPTAYATLCGLLSVPLAIWGWSALSGGRVYFAALLVAIALPAAAAIWLAYFRLRIDDSGIEYRGLFGESFKVAYSEILSIKSRTISTGRYFIHEWTLNLHDGRKLRLNLKPFPRETYGLLSERIRLSSRGDT